MKKILIAITAAIAIIAATACGNSKFTPAQEQAHALDDSLKTALAQADTMYALLYDVTVGLEQITQLEHLLQADINSESPNARADIMKQMGAVQRGLIERRKRIEDLEKQLGINAGENSKLRARLNDLRSQIENQAQTVRDITQRLEQANFRIEELQDSIVGLTASFDSIAGSRADIEQELNRAYDELNTVYYVMGNKGELKDHGFMKGGNIFKKSHLGSDFDLSYMTRADRRTLTSIPLDSKKANLLTEQPESTYRLDKDENGMLTLVITDPEAFWALRDFLVIEIK